jgi:hypothetical protein
VSGPGARTVIGDFIFDTMGDRGRDDESALRMWSLVMLDLLADLLLGGLSATGEVIALSD